MRQASADLAAGLHHAAVGIPQGLITDPETKEVAGAVRRGGELVSLEPLEYALWAAMLTPLTPVESARLARVCRWGDPEPLIARLEDQNLAVSIEPEQRMNDALSRLRPIPLGFGLGNSEGEATRFDIQTATLTRRSPLTLDPISAMFWWEFDGATSLREAAEAITSRIPGLPLDRTSAIAARLACELMRNRMLYLDTFRTPRGAR